MPFVHPWGLQVNEDRIVAKLDKIEEQNSVTLIALTRLQEQMNAVPDHESRLRSLERWKYGLPVTGLTAIVSMGISAWSASKGG